MTTAAERSKVTQTVRFEPSVRDTIVQQARDEGRTIGGQVRRLVDEALEQRAAEGGRK